MKTLVFLRHAKSSWELNVDDRNRPLSENGMDRIKKIAKRSSSVFENADQFFTSPANRAFHTASILMHKLKIPFTKLQVSETLYTFDSTVVLDFIHTLSDELDSVVLVGHNPAFTYAAGSLTTSYLEYLPTAAWVKIEFEQNLWKKIKEGKATFGFPKDILK